MGRKSELEPDASRAKPHDAGARIVQAMVAEHAVLGTLFFERFITYVVHMRQALEARERLAELHHDITQLPLDDSNSRFIEGDLAADAYAAGSRMVVEAVLAVQHFCAVVEADRGYDAGMENVLARLAKAARQGGFAVDAGGAEYAGLSTLVEQRKRIEHPTPRSLTPPTEPATEWDEGPAAWMLTERALEAFDRFRRLMDQVVSDWFQIVEDRQPQPEALTVQRGIGSNRQSKKPPQSPDEG